jgi:hypothetical protein
VNTNIITNQATVTYQDASGNSYTVNSNIVETQITETPTPTPSTPTPTPSTPTPTPSTPTPTPSTPTDNVNITLILQGRQNATDKYSASGVSLVVTDPANNNAVVFQANTVTLDNNGTANVQVSNMTTGTNYDYRIKVDTYLKGKVSGSFTNGRPLDFGQLLAGDIDNNGLVNTIDYSFINAKWFQADTKADINHDGIVNTIDYGLWAGNFNKTDQ